MLYFVSRQKYWPEGTPMVEIALGGLDYANPDMLMPKYKNLGEGKEYNDPREAAEAAIQIVRAWRKDGEKRAMVAHGCTGGMTMPFDPCTIKELQKWADELYEKLPKCDGCGGILPEVRNRFGHHFSDGYPFCSERCAEKDWNEASCVEAKEEDE